MGNKWRYGPCVSMAGDLCFLAINIIAGLYGLIPVCAVAFCIHVRNQWKWYKE